MTLGCSHRIALSPGSRSRDSSYRVGSGEVNCYRVFICK